MDLGSSGLISSPTSPPNWLGVPSVQGRRIPAYERDRFFLDVGPQRLPNVPMPYLSPPTLTRVEQEALLRASSAHPRDHLVISLALGTGLRLAEIGGLNVGDAFTLDGNPRGRIRLRREIAKGGRAGDVFLPDALNPKLRRFWGYKRQAGEGLGIDAPLFCNQAGDRLSKRRVQFAFRRWQAAAGFDRLYPFHALQCRSECTATSGFTGRGPDYSPSASILWPSARRGWRSSRTPAHVLDRPAA